MNISSERLNIRELNGTDADFIVKLLNTDAFKKNIGDRKVRTIAEAEDKIQHFYSVDYPSHGLFAVTLKSTNQAIGTVSYLKREQFEFDDIGYAFLPEFWGQGFAVEATKAVLALKLSQGIKQVWGVVNPDNSASIKLLEKLNFQASGMVLMEGEVEPILKMEYSTETNESYG